MRVVTRSFPCGGTQQHIALAQRLQDVANEAVKSAGHKPFMHLRTRDNRPIPLVAVGYDGFA